MNDGLALEELFTPIPGLPLSWAKAEKFARELTEMLQSDPHLKRFLPQLMVELLAFQGKSHPLKAKSAHHSGNLPGLGALLASRMSISEVDCTDAQK